MLILRPKQTIYIGFIKDSDGNENTKIFNTCPNSGLVFEFLSLSMNESRELLNKATNLYEGLSTSSNSYEDRNRILDEYTEYAKTLVVAIHPSTKNKDDFDFNIYSMLLAELIKSTHMELEDSFFCK